MAGKPRITIVGAGNLAATLAPALFDAGYGIDKILSRSSPSTRRAQLLAKRIGARVGAVSLAKIESPVTWLCVPDSAISSAAKLIGNSGTWKGRVALHSSGALTSDELGTLRRKGAAVASVHPLMTFVRASQPSLQGVPFAIEGDLAALRLARRVIKDLGGTTHAIRKKDKAAYHSWGTFASPLLTAFLATTEQVAAAADVRVSEARKRMLPILQQTLLNYVKFGARNSFSGPIVRGDVETVKRHLRALEKNGAATDVYKALARAALLYLPVKNTSALRKLLR